MRKLEESPYLATTAVAIFDNYRRYHLYESEYHRRIFMDEDGVFRDMHIHPDDIDAVVKNAMSVLRLVFSRENDFAGSKLIRQYRVRINGVYKRITEEMQIIETDRSGAP